MAGLAASLLLIALGVVVVVRAVLLAVILFGHRRYLEYCAHKGRPGPLEGVALLRFVFKELGAMARLGRWQLLGQLGDGLRLGRSRNQGRPVVCVHGFTQNGTNFWGMRRHLERLGHPTCAVSLGLPFRHLEDYAPRLEAAMDTMLARLGDSDGVDVVAHSMGGIITRIVLARRPDLAAKVRHVITIGSPHQGTAGARGITLGHDALEMRRGSIFLRQLPGLEKLCPEASMLTAAAEHDYVVYPEETSEIPGAPHRVFSGIGHAGLLVDPRVWRYVSEGLEVEDRGGRVPATS